MSIDTLTSQQTALPPEVAKPYEAALGLIEQPEFAEGFIEQQTINEQEALDSLIADPRREASAYAKSQIEEFAAHKLGITVEEGRERGKEWGKALKDAGSGTSEQTEGKTLQEYLFDSKLSELETDPQYQEQKTEAEEQLALSRERASQIIFTLLQEFQERSDDPRLVKAIMTWANSPNSMGEVGEDGQGYNAGIVHFFEYRGNKQKASRFKVIEEPPTVDGFIEYSAKIKHDLDYIGNNPDNDEAVLEDEEGNKRIYILRPNGDLIVAFQYAGQSEPHATTVLVRQKPKDFEKNVAASESGNDKGKLNRLGTNVHRLL